MKQLTKTYVELDIEYRKTSFVDLGKPGTIARQYKVLYTGLTPPSSVTWQIECPFCSHGVRAFLWSICGGGKRCEWCGAIMGARGTAYKIKTKEVSCRS